MIKQIIIIDKLKDPWSVITNFFRVVYKHTPHGTGVYPQSAAGTPFTAAYIAVKGDPVADLQEDLAADVAPLTVQHQ